MSNEKYKNNKISIPYGKHNISEEDIEEVNKILKSSNLTQGDTVPNFEEKINDKVQSKFSIAVNSATSALHIACLALGLSKGDYLWTSPTTFVASANCALYCGAEVDFVDIDRRTGLMSIEKLSEKLFKAKKEDKLPKILIPVHLTGNPCQMNEILKLSQRYNFKIIEDASHAIGAKYRGEYIGNCQYSDITIFSFHPVKIITTGEGGLATTNNKELARKMRLLRTHGITKEEKFFENNSPGPWFYEQQNLGFNYRMNDIQAALGISQLKRLDQFVERRNFLLSNYKKLLADLPVNFLEITKDAYSSVHLAVIRLNEINNKLHNEIFIGLRNAQIGVQIHYIPVHLHPFYRKMGFKKGDYPESEIYANNAISLPLFYELKESDQIYVVNTLKSLFEKSKLNS